MITKDGYVPWRVQPLWRLRRRNKPPSCLIRQNRSSGREAEPKYLVTSFVCSLPYLPRFNRHTIPTR